MFPIYSQAQIITAIAGDGHHGYNGDWAPAATLWLMAPAGLAKDIHGAVYIADGGNNCVRKIEPNGIMHTIAGICTGNGGGCTTFTGEGVPGTTARFCSPQGVAVDKSGNVYITDHMYNRIRKLDSSGYIYTIAGGSTKSYGGDGGPASAALINYPWGILVDSVGNIFFSDQDNNCIRKISGGIISTIAGTPGVGGFAGDGGPASSALMYHPKGIAMDCKGNLYISDFYNARIRKIDPSGIITTIGGTGVNGFSGDGGPATAAKIHATFGITVDKAGNVYLADANNQRVRMISNTGIMSTVAGIGYCASLGDGGPATAACFSSTYGVLADDEFNLYISDHIGERVRKVWGLFQGAGSIFGEDRVCVGDSIELSESVSGGVWHSQEGFGAVFDGVVTGITPGVDTITYSIYGGYCPLSAYKVVTVDPLPFAGSINGPSNVCVDDTVVLGATGVSGIWMATNSNVTVNLGEIIGIKAGAVDVMYIVANDCGVDSVSRAITVDSLPYAGIITGPTSLCIGDTIHLLSDVAGGIWNSIRGLLSPTASYFSGLAGGIDTIRYSVSNTCGTAATDHEVFIYSLPSGTIERSKYELSIPDTFVTYQWTLNGQFIPDAIQSTYTFTETGSYSVIVTNATGCSASLLPFMIADCSVEDILIYPNPNNGVIYINWCKQLNVKISNADGKVLKVIEDNTVVDITDLPSGIYFVTLFDINGNKLLTKRISYLKQ